MAWKDWRDWKLFRGVASHARVCVRAHARAYRRTDKKPPIVPQPSISCCFNDLRAAFLFDIHPPAFHLEGSIENNLVRVVRFARERLAIRIDKFAH